MNYALHPIKIAGRVIGTVTVINGILFQHIKGGVLMSYPDGTKRTIMNSFYD